MTEAYLLSGARTPIGKFLGMFKRTPAPTLGAVAIQEALSRAGLGPESVEEVIMGNVITAGVGQAPARQAALAAGIPSTVAALTINKVCGSGLKAVMLAAQAIRSGDARVVVAGGMENMSLAPHLLRHSRDGFKMGEARLEDAMLIDGLWCAFNDCHMGSHAESTANQYKVTREMQDLFALESQQKASIAHREGLFQEEIAPVTISQKGKSVTHSEDEGIRHDASREALAGLNPVFDKSGTVTAGNASTLSDGAAALVVASSEVAAECPSDLKARIVAYHTSGMEPRDLFLAPVEAVRGVLRKAKLEAGDIDLFEINEAFASQMIACLQQLQLDPAKVNIHGGAIALGHPIGASGARVLVTLMHALKRKNLKRGLCSLCLGGGNAVAMIIEREPN